MNRRILILANHDLVIYNFRKELIQKLISEKYEVYISSPNGKRIDELVSMGCQFCELENIDRHGKNPIKEIKLLMEYKKLVKAVNPLCVLTYTIKPNIFGSIAARKYGIPCLSNITGLGSAVEKKSFLQFLTIRMYKYAFKDIDTVFFQNEENLTFFLDRQILTDSFELLPGSGVNIEHFNYLKYPDDDVVRFVFISRIMKEKGIELYLQAAKIIKNKYPNTEFHICGFCEERYEKILEDYHKKGYIIYHGMVDDIKNVLKDTHCTIHPTYYPEGLSNVLLESSACGRPIITTDRSGCREVVTNKNGFLIKENSSEDLIEKIILFLSLNFKEKRKMGENGRELIEREFNREIVVNEYIKKINILSDRDE
ncbi:glycosyltransferase family 4 protein [Vagococcus carniphilus]|uniref:glycosyltransferase family 4 protein n=1 Tax=Vagococcus carniphilus TaxID=218144 RepID=UPI0028917F67|nr:glycosyltransferase family 4 protein [Vagococcus carniphilus]MDT2848679.1 glycosyltransferase family 4 protein [Vagococcus carniphilus]